MGDYHTERYRRGNPWRADNRRDDDLGDPWDDNRGSRWLNEDDWQPESSGDSWDEARRRQRLTPGQLSEGGPAPSGYRESHGERYVEQYGRRDERDARRHGSDLRYGLNGGYGSGDSPEADEQWRVREQYRSRMDASDYGDYGDYGNYGDVGSRRDDGRYRRRGEDRGERERYGAQGFGSADQAWLREAERREPQYGGAYGRHSAYFNDLRSDTRYWTEPVDEWGESPCYAQRYGRDYLGARGDDAYADDREDEHGMLYHIGHRIGQAVSEWFGPDSDEKRPGPRGYTRTDERIRDEICERLTFANGVDVREVTVDVDKGKVTLGGTVRLRSQKYDIEDLADNTFGVTEVENNIRVERPDVDSAVTGAGGFNGW